VQATTRAKTCRRAAGATIALLAAIALVVPVGVASAHTRSSTGYSEIRQDGADVRYELQLEYDVLAKATGLGARALDARTDAARGAALTTARARLDAYLRPRLRVSLDGAGCAGTLTRTGIARRDRTILATLSLTYACPGAASGGYTIVYGVFAEGGGVVDDHTSLADYALDGERGRFVFDAAHRELDAGDAGALATTVRFVALGAEHILEGYDHVLFVVALLLGARGLIGVLKVASAFTLAHSLTLALAVIGWVDVPAEVVEPLIALSIAYVAAENMIGGESRQRLAVVFGFGLLHGLGFASTLSFTEDVGWPLISSLLSFNVGVEIGQALIIALLFPLLLLIRRAAWSSLAQVGVTAAIGAIGLMWFFERMLA